MAAIIRRIHVAVCSWRHQYFDVQQCPGRLPYRTLRLCACPRVSVLPTFADQSLRAAQLFIFLCCFWFSPQSPVLVLEEAVLNVPINGAAVFVYKATFRNPTWHNFSFLNFAQQRCCHFCSFPLLKTCFGTLMCTEQASSRVLVHIGALASKKCKMILLTCAWDFLLLLSCCVIRVGSSYKHALCTFDVRVLWCFAFNWLTKKWFFLFVCFVICIWPAQHV